MCGTIVHNMLRSLGNKYLMGYYHVTVVYYHVTVTNFY